MSTTYWARSISCKVPARIVLLSLQAVLLTLDLVRESHSKADSMRQPSRSMKLSKPPDLSACHPDQQPPRSRRQHNCQCLVLLGLLLLGLLPCSLAAHVHVNKQMRDHLQQWASQLLTDRDYLADVPAHQQVSWGQDLGLNINQTLTAMQSLKVPITVDVKLVGFAGDGNEALHVAEHDLQLFLKALHNELDTVSLHPDPTRMPIQAEISFRVQPVYYELATKVTAELNQAINVGHTSNVYADYLLHMVDYEVVNKIIEEDFSHGDGTHTIYLLNPPSHVPYAYTYTNGMPDTDFCPGSLWVADKRFVWFDLTANLTFYGPGPGGKGQVFAHSTPILKHYRADARPRAILPDLAALVWSGVQHLIWPPLHHSSLTYQKAVSVHLVYMVDGLQKPTVGDGRVDIGLLHDELQTIGEMMQQEVTVSEHYVLFSECDHCVTAYAGALKARTSRKVGSKEFKMATTHYLDLPSLERWLREWKDALLSEAGVNYVDEGTTTIVPVFVFDLPSHEPILLDGLLQAVTMKTGDVVAVRTAARPMPTYFGCFDHQMQLNPRSIHRPVLAAVVEATYGVVDSGLFWSHATGKGWNFVWGVGQTPFGPLSNMASLSFVQRDVAVRNMALSYLNSSLTHAQLLIQGYQWMAPYDGGLQHVKNFLRPDQVIPYNQRLALLLYKLREAVTALGNQQQALALGYAASTMHDVAALHKITRQYKETLNPDLVCMGETKQTPWWMLVGGCVVVTLVLVVYRWVRGPDEDEKMGTMSNSSSRRSSLTDRLSAISAARGPSPHFRGH